MLFEILSLTNIERFIVYTITLSALVLVHEWGHFAAARRSGVGVREFALGFGPALWFWDSQSTGTRYRLNLIPLGGYCAMIGEDASTKADERIITGVAYTAVGPWQRLGIVAAGPVINILVAFLVLWIGAGTYGIPGNEYSTVIGPVTAGAPADKAGLHAGDTILRLDGTPITSGSQMITYIHNRVAKHIVVTYRHDGQEHTAQVTTEARKIDGKTIGLIGFKPVAQYQPQSFGTAGKYAFNTVVMITSTTFGELSKLVRGQKEAVDSISGPIGMARTAVAVQDYGPQLYVSFIALLSLSLGIFNLLPVPALDGGRAIFVIAELLRGKPIDPEKEAMVHLTGFAALMTFILFVTYRDILHIATGQAAF